MKLTGRNTTILLLCLITCLFVKGQVAAFRQLNHSIAYRSELANPKPSDTVAWSKMEEPLLVGFGNADIRYDNNRPVSTEGYQKSWQAIAWKGEKVHNQLLISSKKKIVKARVVASQLVSSNGGRIAASAVEAGFIRYLLSDGLNKEGHGCGISPANQSDSFLVADGIDFIDEKSMPAFTTQPIWLSVAVPENAATGKYTGTIDVQLDGESRTLDYSMDVKAHTLPKPKDWKFHLDLWQNPYSVSRYFNVKDWSDEHFSLMKPSMQILANAGQKTITVSMIYDPWRGQTYDIYKSMIRWVKKKNGRWSYDYSVFDSWVQFMMNLGIDKLINCYTMVPWNNKFYYYDEVLGKETVLIAKTGSAEYNKHWLPMLSDFAKHLKKKGWFNMTAIAMDERALEDMQKVIALIRSVDKGFKISLAGSYHAEIANEIYDYCVASAEKFDSGIKADRITKGLPTTYYTYCWEGKPNTFTFSPPAESAWLPWYSVAQNYNGYLRWAYNCWPKNPMQDARFSTWSSGDTYFVYPGGSSIRFERLLEGIQDYEKIRILKTLFLRNNDLGKLQQLDALLSEFTLGALTSESAAEMLAKAKRILNSF